MAHVFHKIDSEEILRIKHYKGKKALTFHKMRPDK
jgi:hypothetical protein